MNLSPALNDSLTQTSLTRPRYYRLVVTRRRRGFVLVRMLRFGLRLSGLLPFRRRRRWTPPHSVLKPEFPDHAQRLAHNTLVHLGVSLKTVGENNRHLDDLHPLTPDLVRHFDLEAVAVRLDLIELDRVQRAPAETFVAA